MRYMRASTIGLGLSAGVVLVLLASLASGQDKPAGDQPPPPKEDAAAAEEAASKKLANEVKEILRANCFDCHGGSQLTKDLNVSDYGSVQGKQKRIRDLIVAQDGLVMPPPGQPRLTSEDTLKVISWLDKGLPEWDADVPAPFKGEDAEYVMQSILKHCRSVKDPTDRIYLRYFSMAHIGAEGATPEELEYHRDALTLAINHLTWNPKIVMPKPVDEGREVIYAGKPTRVHYVYCIDLRELGWHERPYEIMSMKQEGGFLKYVPKAHNYANMYDLCLLDYPYGVMYTQSQTYVDLYREYLAPGGEMMMVRPIPYVRADWFCSVVTSTPLYEDMLQLPFQLKDLEYYLGIDSQANIDDYLAQRAGMTISGVSRNNRVVEYHPPSRMTRYYYKSYDFPSSKGTDNMFRDPINFQPAGGEMIWSLPNGLQGYYVADGAGNRIGEAPTSIVVDNFASDKTVRNGLACIRCHDQGVKRLSDSVRPAVLGGPPDFRYRLMVEKLYPEREKMDKIVEGDVKHFLAACEKVYEGRKKESALKAPLAPSQPLVRVAGRYLDSPMSLTLATRELGLKGTDELRNAFKTRRFSFIGLNALGAEPKGYGGGRGTVRRDMWEDYFDQVVRGLELGTPMAPLDGLMRKDYHVNHRIQYVLGTNIKGGREKDKVTIFVDNKSDCDIYVELVVSSDKGFKSLLTEKPVLVQRGKKYEYPAIEIQKGAGKEEITAYACDFYFEPAELWRLSKESKYKYRGMADRVVHRIYEPKYDRAKGGLYLPFEPARMVKKTITFTTL